MAVEFPAGARAVPLSWMGEVRHGHGFIHFPLCNLYVVHVMHVRYRGGWVMGAIEGEK